MAAYTTFTREALIGYVRMFGIGDLESFEPITEGIENSNYFVTIIKHDTKREYVLSIIEQLGLEELSFFSQILQRLSLSGIPVPMPKRTLDGMTSTIFCGKPTLLTPRLKGMHVQDPSTEQCQILGKTLATIHLNLSTEECFRENPYSPDWMEMTITENTEELSSSDLTMLNEITKDYRVAQNKDLPSGIIHGDLFRDNVLFKANEVMAILDFFNACNDFWLQDIAIAINDWCVNKNGGLVKSRGDAFLDGYSEVRALEEEELKNLIKYRIFSAARLALTRQKRDKSGAHLKDPEEYLNLTRQLYQYDYER